MSLFKRLLGTLTRSDRSPVPPSSRSHVTARAPALWYVCLADVPDVFYQTPPSLDVSALPERGFKPSISTRAWDPAGRKQVEWLRNPQGYGSRRSPAREWKTTPRQGERAIDTALREMHEALALPGQLTDYYFVLLEGVTAAWRERVGHPWAYEEIERLSLLAITLIETQYDALAAENVGSISHLGVPFYDMLLSIYRREGHLREMRELIERAESRGIGHFSDARETLMARLAKIEGLNA